VILKQKVKLIIDKIKTQFIEYQEVFFDSQVSELQITLVKNIDKILDSLDTGKNSVAEKGFNSWNGNELIRSEERLSRYSETLGEFITFHESRSDFTYIWRKGAYAKDWLPVKTKLKNDLGKTTNTEVEMNLTDKYIGEQYYSMFHRRRADYLVRKLNAIGVTIRTIIHRIKELERQENLKHN